MKIHQLILPILLLLMSHTGFAEEMLMARIPQKASIVLDAIKTAIKDHGYAIAHRQKCDSGMKGFGYQSDMYRVLFFAKGDEIRKISEKRPEFTAYLPLKVAVVAERNETVLTIVNPLVFNAYYPNDTEMRTQFGRWYNDIQSILNEVQKSAGVKVIAEYKQ